MAALALRSVDLQKPQNNKDHHTKEMGPKRLVVRRGQPFALRLHFNRPFRAGSDSITFIAETGEFTQPQVQVPLKLPLPLLPEPSPSLLQESLGSLVVLLREDLSVN